MNPPLIIIMAGGLGKRMNSELPKVLHCVNEVPMIVKIIREAQALSPIRILIVVGKYRDIIKETINKFITETNNIDYIIQPEPLGTGDAIKCCIPRLNFFQQFYITYDVLILSGDVPLIISDTMKMMLKNLKYIRIMSATMDNPSGYGRIICSDDNDEFEKIVEDKDCTPEQRLCKKVNVGIYAFDVNILTTYLYDITNTNNNNKYSLIGEYYLTDIVEIIKTKENIDIDVIDIPADRQHEIMGVNTPEQLEFVVKYSKTI